MLKKGGVFRHRPLLRMKKRQEGILFTVPVIVSVMILLAVLFVCIFAPLISPYSPTQQNLADSLALPSSAHLLGADKVGRDLLTRLFYGGRTTLLSAVGVVVFSIIVGVPLGLVSGYYRGPLDTVIGRACDLILSFPSLLLAFVFVAGFGRSIVNAVIALGIVYVPMLTRLVHTADKKPSDAETLMRLLADPEKANLLKALLEALNK